MPYIHDGKLVDGKLLVRWIAIDPETSKNCGHLYHENSEFARKCLKKNAKFADIAQIFVILDHTEHVGKVNYYLENDDHFWISTDMSPYKRRVHFFQIGSEISLCGQRLRHSASVSQRQWDQKACAHCAKIAGRKRISTKIHENAV
jgi:hypothetical protein